jgi:hypothetical protein
MPPLTMSQDHVDAGPPSLASTVTLDHEEVS